MPRIAFTTDLAVQDEGVAQGAVTTVNYTGSVTATVSGTTATVNVPTPTVAVKDEGVSQGSASSLDFTGQGVSATVSGAAATVNVTGAVQLPTYSGIDNVGLYTIDGETSEFDVYISSGWTQEMPGGGYGLIGTQGTHSPSNKGRDSGAPLAEFRDVLVHYPPGFRLSSQIHIHLADAAGFTGGTQTSPLYYQLDEWTFGGFMLNANAYTIEGPPKMRIVAALTGFVGSSQDGSGTQGWTALQFAPGQFTADQHTFNGWLGCLNSDGTYRIFEIPISHHTSTVIYVPDQGAMAGAFPADGIYSIRRPGVYITSRRDHDTLITGQGSPIPGLYQKAWSGGATDDDAQNPRPTIRNVEFGGLWVFGHGISLENVGLVDHPLVIAGQHFGAKNVKTAGGVFVHGGSFAPFGYRNNTHDALERRRRMYVPAGITCTSPQVYCDIAMVHKGVGNQGRGMHVAGGSVAGGTEHGSAFGHHAHGAVQGFMSISGYDLSEPVITAYDHASVSLMDYAAIAGHNVAGLVKATGKAEVRVYGAGLRRTGTGAGTNDLVIGRGTAHESAGGKSVAQFNALSPRNWWQATDGTVTCPARIVE